MKKIFTLGIVACLLSIAAFAQGPDATELKALELKAASDPDNIELWLDLGKMQFRAARGRDEALLEAALRSFEHVLERNAEEPRALVWHGTLLAMRSGRLFQAGNLAEAQRLLTQGFSEMDRGIAAAPRDPELRRLRGQTNLRVPEFLGRTALGVEDYEIVLAHPSFESLAPAQKAESYVLVGTAYGRLGKAEQARQMWQKAVAVAPESSAATEAKKQLDRVASPALASSGARPDRLTGIPDDVGPIMAVASVAFKPGAQTSGVNDKEFDELMDGLKKAKGFMGVRVLQSADNPPMFVLISWWKNRGALVDWYYNPVHQKMIQGFQSGFAGTAKSADSSPAVHELVTHISIQFYAPLRGGGTIGEPFGPRQQPVQ